ncbi:MAG: hydroxymethylpyrimidine/phosphomethylpyrimidine kinase [Sphingomonadaceae bacterium]
MTPPRRRTVLVFAGVDPSGGAGIGADLHSIAALGAHALTVVTALTVQDHQRAYAVQPVAPDFVQQQAQALIASIAIDAVKIGIPGSAANARAIARIITALRARQPTLPVVLDPVLASGHGDTLSVDDAVAALAPLLPLVTLLTPNGPEAQALSARYRRAASAAAPAADAHAAPVADAHAAPAADAHAGAAGGMQVPAADAAPAVAALAAALQDAGCQHVLLTGGHGDGPEVINHWFGPGAGATGGRRWHWPRLPGTYHGSGCTLAAACAALLAQQRPLAAALEQAQAYCHATLRAAYAIGPGQRIPCR